MLTSKQEVAFFSFLGAIVIGFIVLIILLGNKVSRVEEEPQVARIPSSIVGVEVEAKAALVYDTVSKKVLYEKNADYRLPLASLTKLMTALVASETLTEEAEVEISNESIKTEGDTGLVVGEKWRLKDILDFSLVNSSNDGVRAVALAIGSVDSFVQRMNTRASQLGMKNTYYRNDTGLDLSKSDAGAYGSARDQAILLEYILRSKPYLLLATKAEVVEGTSLNGRRHLATNTNSMIEDIPGFIASKTGSTDLAGANLVVAFDPEIGHPIIAVILGSTEEERFNDMKKLVLASLESVRSSIIADTK